MRHHRHLTLKVNWHMYYIVLIDANEEIIYNQYRLSMIKEDEYGKKKIERDSLTQIGCPSFYPDIYKKRKPLRSNFSLMYTKKKHYECIKSMMKNDRFFLSIKKISLKSIFILFFFI